MFDEAQTRRPVLLLDVDGTLNADDPHWGCAPHRGHAYAHGFGYRMRWAPPLVSAIRSIAMGGLAEVMWSTTWCGNTAQIENLMGFPHFEDAFTIEPGKSVALLKLESAVALARAGRNVIWCDDHDIPQPGSVLDRVLVKAGALLVRPQERNGLTPEHMDAITRHIANLPARGEDR